MQLICGDAIEGMKMIPDHSVDMILTDLPYGITNNGWDKILPFDQLWEQYKRIIKKNGAVALFAMNKFMGKVIESKSRRIQIRERLCWIAAWDQAAPV